MTSPIFIDANVPIYASGGPHPLRGACGEVVLLAAGRPELFFTSAEVLQELLHYYLRQGRLSVGQGVLTRFAALMKGRVEPIYAADVENAAALDDRSPGLEARDLLHAAVMGRMGTSLVVTTDRDFDRVPGLRRLNPAAYAVWRQELVG